MTTSNNVTEITKALLNAWNSLQNLSYDKAGFTNKYTTLLSIIDHVKPILLTNNIFCIQSPTGGDGGNVGITTRLQHVSGEYFEDTFYIPATELAKANSAQKIGSSITYGKRYALTSMLFIATGDDLDSDMKHDDIKGGNGYTMEAVEAFIRAKNWDEPRKKSMFALCKKYGETYIRKIIDGEIK